MENKEKEVHRILKLVETLKNKVDGEQLLTPKDLLDQNLPIKGINKLEPMGGEYSMRSDLFLIDLKAKQGLQTSILEANHFLESDPQSDTIFILNNPYFKEDINSSTSMNRLLQVLNKISGTKTEGQDVYIILTGTQSNKFFNRIKPGNQGIPELEQFEFVEYQAKFVEYQAKLPEFYSRTRFFTTNGQEIDKAKMKITILKKKNCHF